ncbi:MAG TPA: TOBE domain-containing protein [Fibrobacteraceae bacterium]|nr:TOBE domain-containing protein [Fibrobacteraceae bacterium]
MKLSARNLLPGTVVKVTNGAVNAEVVLKLDGGTEITSVVTLGALTELGLKPGTKAYAVVKASNVILAVD